jgi:hypothetical protein
MKLCNISWCHESLRNNHGLHCLLHAQHALGFFRDQNGPVIKNEKLYRLYYSDFSNVHFFRKKVITPLAPNPFAHHFIHVNHILH